MRSGCGDGLILAIGVVDYGPNGSENPGKASPEVGQDLSDVVAAGAERGKEGVADGAFQWASR